MTVYIVPDLEMILAHKRGVNAAIVRETKERAQVAEGLLKQAKASTPHVKFDDEHDHETQITTQFGGVDGFFSMDSGGSPYTSAKSIEFGHNPSGVFGPGGRYGHRPSKPPEGLYILHRAAGLL